MTITLLTLIIASLTPSHELTERIVTVPFTSMSACVNAKEALLVSSTPTTDLVVDAVRLDSAHCISPDRIQDTTIKLEPFESGNHFKDFLPQ